MSDPPLARAGITAALAVLCWAVPADAEWIVSAYGGAAFTRPADVRIEQPDRGTSLQFDRVPFDHRSFEAPIYYGSRVARAIPRARGLFIGGGATQTRLGKRQTVAHLASSCHRALCRLLRRLS